MQIFPLLASEFQAGLAALSSLKDSGNDASKRPADEKPAEAGKKKQKILAVEDNEINQTVLLKQLELLGYQADVAADGHEGYARWLGGGYDRILTDCHMPGMDGFEMTRLIRGLEMKGAKTPTRIVAITANAMEGDAQKCLTSGTDDFLAKPVQLDALRDKLAENLN